MTDLTDQAVVAAAADPPIATNPAAGVSLGQIRYAAMDLLSRREHLHSELLTKLARRFAGESELIEQVVDELREQQLQCDQRFCDSYVAQRAARGYGPERIRMELRQKGAAAEQLAWAMETSEIDWLELARQTRDKKFGDSKPEDFREKSKQMRFLQYRGFGGEHAAAACSAD